MDIHNNLTFTVALSPQTIATDTTTAGTIIDTRDYEQGLEFVVSSGTLTDGAYTVLVEEGDVANLSDAAAVADADLLGTEADASFALADDDTSKSIGYVGDKRYVRLSIVSTSTTTGGLLSAVAVQKALVR